MALTHVDLGYTQTDYAVEPYATGIRLGALGAQATAVIAATLSSPAQGLSNPNREVSAAVESLGIVEIRRATGAQGTGVVSDYPHAAGAQGEAVLAGVEQATGAQAEARIYDALKPTPAQLTAAIQAAMASGAQGLARVEARLQVLTAQVQGQIVGSFTAQAAQGTGTVRSWAHAGAQAQAFVTQPQALAGQGTGQVVGTRRAAAAQANQQPVFHSFRGYAVDDYLTEDYGKAHTLAALFAQGRADILAPKKVAPAQARVTINYRRAAAAQAYALVTVSRALGAQADYVRSFAMGAQARSVLYNTTNLRVLWDFPSRGDGTSWTANVSASGDWLPDNLNTDLVEQAWRSPTGIKTGIQLVCDTGLAQGVYLDTLAILGHNMTKSASIILEGSNTADFTVIGTTKVLAPVELENTYYIAPELPMNGYRYWRFSIDDPTNQANYVQIGSIVFGEATIMHNEQFANPIRFSKVHYSDTVFTEGFTNVSNDRGIKRKLGLDFQSLDFSGGNYAALTQIFETARTNLKCLWIPTPRYPSRYAVFGKLVDLPQEEHNDNGESSNQVSFTIEVDEAK